MKNVKRGTKVTLYHHGQLRIGIVRSYAKKRSKNRNEPWWWIRMDDCPDKPMIMKPQRLLVEQ